MSRRQAGRWAAQDDPQAYPAPPAAAPPVPDPVAQLKQLAELHEQDVLTDEEFAIQKAKLLG